MLRVAIILSLLGSAVGTLARADSISFQLPAGVRHPFLACNAEELARLRIAWAETGLEHDAVARIVRQTDRALAEPVTYPPRGGQHNQWYQCDACQIELKRIDDTHHQCPRCKKIYSGAPYDDVIYARRHHENLRRLNLTAWAYAITADTRYARYAANILTGYARRYLDYPYHTANNEGSKPAPQGGHLFEQTLTEAAAAVGSIFPAYDLIHDSGALNADDDRAVRDRLIRPILQNICKNRAGKSNWQSWHNAALVWGGALLDEREWIDYALNAPGQGFIFQMQNCVLPEGMWFENSWSYHFFTLRALAATAEGARRIGIDLWSDPQLKKMFTLPARYTMPDGTLPRYGDSVTTDMTAQLQSMMAGAKAYDDPGLHSILGNKPTFDSVLLGVALPREKRPSIQTSELFAGNGHAILRTEGEAGLAAAITFAPFGGFHGHFDKLSFIFFGHGRELGVDPGRAASQAYRLPIHKSWYRNTISHNAVLVDQQPQQGAAGTLNYFKAEPRYAIVSASADEAYPGVQSSRILLLTPTYLLVVDSLSSEADHRFDWLYHHRGPAVRSDMAQKEVAADKSVSGMEYMHSLRAGESDACISVEFPDDRGATWLTTDAQP